MGPSHSIRQLQLSRLTFDLPEIATGISECLRALVDSISALQQVMGHEGWHGERDAWHIIGQE